MNKKFIQKISLLVLVSLLQVFCSFAQAQEAKVTIHMDNVRMEQVMNEIEQQTKYLFGSVDNVDVNRKVSINVANVPVRQALDTMLKGTGFTYTIEGSNIVLGAQPVQQVRESARPVSGVIVDAQGFPVIGAAVILKGSTVGAITDEEGKFSMMVPAPVSSAVLEINCLGYKTQEITVGQASRFDILLKEDSEMLDDVLVVGYTPMRKSDFTGSIASIKADELLSTTPTMAQALAGKIAGVEVRQSDGAPGAGTTIRVRGVNSLSASSEPLYVIDGYPASEDVYINPNDIESIDVLKDAASAAIYGSRGASGVVLITTKRGKEGEAAKVTYDFSYGIQQLEHKVDLLNATEFRDLYIDSRNDTYRRMATMAGVDWSPYDDNATRTAKGFSLSTVGLHPMFYDFTTREVVEPEYDTDWQDILFRNAGMMRHNISAKGGSKAVRYMASLGYMDQDGIISPSSHTRINARLNLDAQITDNFTVSMSYSSYDVKNKKVQAAGRWINDGIIQSALMYLPNLPAYNEDGSLARSAMIDMVPWGMNPPENPLVIAQELDITEDESRHSLNFNFEYEPVKDLKISARLGQQWYIYRYFYYRPLSIGRNNAPAYSPELAAYNISRTTSTYDIDRLGEFTANYKKNFGEHHIDALIGYTLQKKTYDRVGVEATGFSDDRIHEVTSHGPEASDIKLYKTRKAAWSMMSYLARLNYSYGNRYTATVSFRADGSSRFGTENRWGYFPSVSGGWTISNEPFLKDALDDIASIRVRASWGKSGNNNIGDYTHLSNIATGGYVFGTTAVNTSGLSGFADSGLGWETTNQTNIGLDLGFFDNRINLIANYYNSISTDILYSAPLPSISGFTSTTTNMRNARIRNRGFDVQLDTRILTGELTWNASVNVSVNRNKVLSLGGLDDILSTSERSVQSHITKEGYPIGSFYGYDVIGIMSELDYQNALKDKAIYTANGNTFPEGYVLKGPAVASYSLDDLSYGNAIYRDVNEDGVITVDDKTVIGDAYPDFTGGFSTSLAYKGFDLSANFTYSVGAEVINFQDYYLFNMEGSSNQYAIVNDRYISDENYGKNNVPIATRMSVSNTNMKLSSYYVEDASYFRFSNVTLGYSLPENFLKKIKVDACRIYVSGDNLFTLTNYRGYNPEVSYKSSNLLPGFDWGCYPLSRIWSAGLSITF